MLGMGVVTSITHTQSGWILISTGLVLFAHELCGAGNIITETYMFGRLSTTSHCNELVMMVTMALITVMVVVMDLLVV